MPVNGPPHSRLVGSAVRCVERNESTERGTHPRRRSRRQIFHAFIAGQQQLFALRGVSLCAEDAPERALNFSFEPGIPCLRISLDAVHRLAQVRNRLVAAPLADQCMAERDERVRDPPIRRRLPVHRQGLARR